MTSEPAVAGGVVVREETAADHEAVRQVHRAAFATGAEADLVDALRRQARPCVSLVAVRDGAIDGHILFSPVTLPAAAGLLLMGMAPLAVAPARQRGGVGAALLKAGLQRCRQLGAAGVVVLGEPGYYSRFGFRPAALAGLRCAYDVPEEAFMLLELTPSGLQGLSGTVSYHPAFAALPADDSRSTRPD